jgi:hypothetical protein
MGRKATGIYCTCEAERLEISTLKRMGFLQPGTGAIGFISWSSRGSKTMEAQLTTKNTKAEKSLEITFTEKEREHKARIDLTTRPSNLGKGDLLFFICPVTGKPCRILYKAYGLPGFISREAYSLRYGVSVYYETQSCSKYERFNTKFWALERKLKPLTEKRKALLYAGKPTKRALRMERLYEEQGKVDYLRFTEGMPKSLLGKLEL